MILLLAYFGCKKVDSDPAPLSNTGNKNNDYLLVNAGMAQAIALPANFVTLSGIATDSGSLIASYTWSQISGPDTALVVSASNLQTLVAGLKAGVYVFQLTVRDTSKLADSSRVTVTVNSSASKVLQTWKLLASKDTSATWDSVNYSLVSFSYSYYCIKGPVGSPVVGRQVLSPFSCS